MDCLRQASLPRPLLMPKQFWIACGVTILVAGVVLYLSIGRAYDTVPDQDLLWLSEALRLYRGAPTTYIDHPGALWTMTYLVNLHILHHIGLIQYTVGDGISIADTITLVRVARMENMALCSIAIISLWPIARGLGLDCNKAMIWIILLSTSSGFLWSLVQIRHEMASILFASLFLILIHCSSQLKQFGQAAKSLTCWLLAIASLIFAMYCKIQIILAFPVLLTALIAIEAPCFQQLIWFKNYSPRRWMQSSPLESGALALSLMATTGLVIRYTKEQGYPLDFRSIGFWIALNLALTATGFVCTGSSQATAEYQIKSNNEAILNSLRIIAPIGIETFFAAVLFRGSWTAGWSGTVFRAPTEIFGGRGLYYSGGNEAVKHGLRLDSIARSLSLRLEQTFLLPSWATLTLLSIICVALIAWLTMQILKNQTTLRLRETLLNQGLGAMPLAIIAISVTVIANSARDQNFYAIYIAIPIIYILLLLSCRAPAVFNPPNIIRLLASLLVVLALLRSLHNILNISEYTTFDHHGTLCYGQQMDIEMRHTSIGKCSNYSLEMKS